MAPASQEAGGSSSEPTIGRVLMLLKEALQLLDALREYPALGARLQEVIDGLEESQP